jgi:hypothetical protein
LSNSEKGFAASDGRLPPGEPAGVFIAHLDELPLAAWIAATRQRQHVPERAKAEAALAAVVRDVSDRFWFLRCETQS